MPNASFTDLFGSDILLHCDASNAGSMFTDTAGTTSAADGDMVKCWKPQTDAAKTGFFTEATNGPTYRADYNSEGYPALEFNGTNQRLTYDTPGIVPFTRIYLIAVVKRVAATIDTWIAIGASSVDYVRVHNVNSTTIRLQSAGTGGGASALAQAAVVNSTTLKMAAGAAIGSGHNVIETLDGAAASITSNVISSGVADRVVLGARPDGANFFPGAMYEFLVVAGTCEWGQVVRALTLLRDKWGITDPNAVPQAPASGGGYYNPFRNPVFGG